MVGMGPVFTGAAMPSAAATVGAEAQVGMAGIVVVTSVEAAAIVVVLTSVVAVIVAVAAFILADAAVLAAAVIWAAVVAIVAEEAGAMAEEATVGTASRPNSDPIWTKPRSSGLLFDRLRLLFSLPLSIGVATMSG